MSLFETPSSARATKPVEKKVVVVQSSWHRRLPLASKPKGDDVRMEDAKTAEDCSEDGASATVTMSDDSICVDPTECCTPKSKTGARTWEPVVEERLEMVQLPDPKHYGESPVKSQWYALGEKHLFEVAVISDADDCHSLFAGDYVFKDGSIQVLSILDPLFVLVPLLMANRVFSPVTAKVCFTALSIDDAVQSRLLQLQNCDLELVCDTREVPGETDLLYALKTDEELVKCWLKPKIKRMAALCRDIANRRSDAKMQESHSLCERMDSIQFDSDKSSGMHDSCRKSAIPVAYFTEAIAILSEYICESLLKAVCKECEIALENVKKLMKARAVSRKRKLSTAAATDENVPPSDGSYAKSGTKKQKLYANASARDLELGMPQMSLQPTASEKRNAGPRTRANKKLAQASTKGMKSIFSYFAKPKK